MQEKTWLEVLFGKTFLEFVVDEERGSREEGKESCVRGHLRLIE
jgi:hypothetical protein